MRNFNRFKIVAPLVLLLALAAANVYAEALIESSVESRLYLMFQAQENDLQSMLPEPWKVSSFPAGPAKGANLNVIFVQPYVTEGSDGKPMPAAALSRYVVLTIPVKHAQTGEESSFVARIYSTDPSSNPGHVKSALPADIRREFTQRFEKSEPGSGSDLWEMKDAAGGTMKVHLTYTKSAVNRAKRDYVVRFASDPNAAFKYHVEQSAELLKSEVLGVTQLQSYEFRSTVPELAKLFDNNAKLVTILEIPCYYLQVAVP